MALTDIFRPKYKHSDAQVRAEAVRQMGSDEAELLARIAHSDRDPSVRRLAIERIDDADLLVDLMANDDDPATRRDAQNRAAEIWLRDALGSDGERAIAALSRLSLLDDQRFVVDVVEKSPLAEVRDVAVGRITDNRALAELARRSKDSETRRIAIERIDDSDTLRAIAMDETRKAVGVAAVDRIDDDEILELLTSKAKSKHVRNRAKKRLAERNPPEETSDEDKRDHAARVQLATELKQFERPDDWASAHARVVELLAEWNGLGDDPDSALTKRFRRGSELFLKQYETVGKKAIAAAEERAARKAEEKARLEAEALRPKPAAPEPEPEAQVEAQVEAAADEAPAPAKRKELSDDEREAKRAEKRKVNMARLQALCLELEELAEEKRYRTIDQKVSAAGKVFDSLRALPTGEERDALVARYDELRKGLIIRSQEMREADEWKRWAAVAKLEALIKRAEALLQSEDVSSLGKELKALQAEWKATGPAPRAKNQELWERFKPVCDQVYERVKQAREARQGEQRENLEAKKALCDKVEALAESTDWEETANEIKRLQAEWKTIGPVPRRQSQAVWKRFRAACDLFFERRAPHLEDRISEQTSNLEQKQEVCVALEALAEEEGEWEEVSQKLTELRRRWRSIGRVPRKDLGPVGERYKAACDAVFAKRKAAEEAALNEVRKRVEGYLSELDVAMSAVEVDAGWDDEPAEDSGVDATAVVKLTSSLYGAARELPEADSTLRERAEALVKAALSNHADAFKGSALDPDQVAKKREALCERLEALLPSEPEPTPDEGELSAEEMAEKLRGALAENALGGVHSEHGGARPVSEIIADAEAEWRGFSPVPGAQGTALEDRFATIVDRLHARIED